MRFWTKGVQVAALVLVAGFGVACETQDDDEGAVATTDSLTATPPAAPALTDANIAMIVMTANTADSTAGELAQTKGTDAEIKAYGKRMATDHGAVNQQAAALAASTGLQPADNDDSNRMRADAQTHMTTLEGLSGAEFDKAYIDHEVTMHQQVLDALDQQLIPNAQNAELKKLLEDTRPAIQAHLDAAKGLQTKLSGT
jgi:putative membrane protein